MQRMYLYRVYTENKQYEDVVKLADSYFPSFTVYKAEGTFQGQREHALIIEIIDASASIIEMVNGFAWDLKKLTNQDTVLVTYQEIEAKEMR